MADIHRLPNIKEIERQASEWIARLDAEDVSAEDRAQFDAWLHSHPLHARTHEELLSTWRQFTAAAPLIQAAGGMQPIQRSAAWYRLQRWPKFATAASVLVAAVLLGFYVHSLTLGAKFETRPGERATLSLPDGSMLQLNSDSRVRVAYSLRSRVVQLERGEAFFTVAHNVNRPFWVTSGDTSVRAVGTAFGVYLYSKGIQVTVHEGAVKLGSALLTAGEQADFDDGVTTTRKLSKEELARAAGWQNGWVHVENKNLCDVIAELNRYTPRRLELKDAHLCSLSVGGVFQANPQGAEALLTMLEQNFDARIRRDGDRVYIEAANIPSASVQP